MECNKTYSNFSTKKELFSDTLELNLDIAVSLMQYCSDILSVKRCKTESVVTGCELLPGEIKVHGKTTINVVYINDSGCISSFDYEEEFTKSVTTDKDYSQYRAKAVLTKKYDNHKIISQRRIDVSCALNLYVCIYCYEQNSAMLSCDNANFKKEKYSCLVPICEDDSLIEFDELCEINPDGPAIKNIISCFKRCNVTEIKLIKDKLLIKANIDASICYLNEKDEISKFVNNFEVSKIIEVPGTCEDSLVFSRLSFSNFCAKAKSDNENALRNIEIFGSLIAEIEVFNEDSICVCTDSYSKYKCEQKLKNAVVFSDGEIDCAEKSLVIEAGFNNADIKEIIDINVFVNKFTVNCNSHYVDAEFCTEAFIINGENEYMFVNSFETKRFSINKEFTNCKSNISLLSLDYTLKSGDKIEIRANAEFKCMTYNYKPLNYISSYDLLDDENIIDSPALTVYFAKANEELWDIAKKFNSDVDLIISENELSEERLSSPQIILIPGV